jgi:hypothetical protein
MGITAPAHPSQYGEIQGRTVASIPFASSHVILIIADAVHVM